MLLVLSKTSFLDGSCLSRKLVMSSFHFKVYNNICNTYYNLNRMLLTPQ